MIDTVTLSASYRIRIPESVRLAAGWQAGEKLVPLVRGRQVTLVPLRTLKEMRGFIKGAQIGEVREHEDCPAWSTCARLIETTAPSFGYRSD